MDERQCEGVNRIVSGEIFGGGGVWGDQNFRTCGPGAWAFPARAKGSQDEDV